MKPTQQHVVVSSAWHLLTASAADPVEITGFLLTAHRVTGKQRYLDALAPLLAAAGPYAIGFPAAIANGQITVPEDYNFSDDELDFLAYFNLLMVSTGRFANAFCRWAALLTPMALVSGRDGGDEQLKPDRGRSRRHRAVVGSDCTGARGNLERDGARVPHEDWRHPARAARDWTEPRPSEGGGRHAVEPANL